MTEVENTVIERSSVVVVGAGLSGLTAAHELVARGIDVIVLEAQDEPGGRLKSFHRPNGGRLVRGGEFIGETYTDLLALAAGLGLEYETLPAYREGAPELAMIRVAADGEQVVESVPFDRQPASAAELRRVVEALDALARSVDPREPWRSPDAAVLDAQTVGAWLRSITDDADVRAFLASDLVYMGDHDDVSLLQLAHFIACFGDYERHDVLTGRIAGGTSLLVDRLVERHADVLRLGSPVHTVESSADGVVIRHRGGEVHAGHVIFAMEPGQVSSIEFVPPLPHARDRMQARWLAGHGVKVVAVYDRPFWFDDGLSGLALGAPPFQQVLDNSPVDLSEGVLVAFHVAGNPATADFSELLSDPERTRAAVLARFVSFFGEQAASPRELHIFDFAGSRWSQGCAPQLPLRVLSTLGSSLREPVGRVHWAGADTEDVGWLEGAVRAGIRAAGEVEAADQRPA